MKNLVRIVALPLLFLASTAVASFPDVAASTAPVVLGQWHSNLEAAKAAAKAWNAPLLVVWGDPDCAFCKDFTNTLMLAECREYLDQRGLVMVYEKTYAEQSTAIKQWVGVGNWPLLRVTWWRDGTVVADSLPSGWQRPNAVKGKPDASFSSFKSTLERYISTYTATPWKDSFDPTNDTAVGAVSLTWKDQVQTLSMKLATTNNPEVAVYADAADWFQFSVVSGVTYRVSVSNVTGVVADTPRIGIYGGTNGTPEIVTPQNLALGNYQFVPGTNGTLYAKVWRETTLDPMIQYVLRYQRYAPGKIEFASTNVTVSEKAKSVTLTLKRTGGTSGAATVIVGYRDSSNSGNTATSGQDFTGPSTTLTWADGDAANKTITIPLIKKVTLWESDETFEVSLTPNVIVSPDVTAGNNAVVTILEVDTFSVPVNSPNPASGSVILERNVGVFAWADVLAVAADATGNRTYNVYAGTTTSSQTTLLATGLRAAEINLATNAAFQALVTAAKGKTLYWRVDSVYKTSVSKGPVWAITVLPNGSPEFLDPSTVMATNLFVGVQAMIGPLAFTNGLGGTPSISLASGGGALPSGMTLSIRNTNEVWITGVPTRVSSGTFIVQIKTKVGTTLNPGTTRTIVYKISSLPTYTVGSYSGWVGDLLETGVTGTINLSVTSAGRITGKAVFPVGADVYSGTYSFASSSLVALSNETAWVSGVLTRLGAASVPVTFRIALADGTIEGEMGAEDAQVPLVLFRNNWSLAGMKVIAQRFAGYYTAAFPVLITWPEDAPAGSGYGTFTLDANGGFKLAGKLADGTTLSQSGTLFLDLEGGETNVCALLFSAPTAYKGGLFAGVICFGDFNTNGVIDVTAFEDAPLQWSNKNPLSVPTYSSDNPGFDISLGVSGGWYNKLTNLANYYAGKVLSVGDLAEPPALSYQLQTKELDENNRTVTTTTTEETAPVLWQSITNALTVTPRTDGTGFTVAAADLKQIGKDEDGMPLYNYDTAVNPSGLRMTFNRATGLMTGSFNVYYDYASVDNLTGDTETFTWAHTAKSCSYACVLLPERADLNSGIEGDGYYLFGGSSSYETGTGATKAYTLNYSYRFDVESDPVVSE